MATLASTSSDICSQLLISSSTTSTICFSCQGVGTKHIKGGGKKGCNPCKGTGFITRNRQRKSHRGKVSYPSFKTIGPLPVIAIEEAEKLLQPHEEFSFLTGHWRIIQTVDNHRFSSDDLLTAFIACREFKTHTHSAVSESSSYSCKMLDLGCGLGSILLMFAWQLPVATCVGIEAQMDRFALARRSIEVNLGRDDGRVQVFHKDIRNFSLEDKFCTDVAPFDVITGSPPYFKGHLLGQPGSFQTAGCIYELRGGIEEYCTVAYNIMNCQHNGQVDHPCMFIVCMTALSSDRVYAACNQLGMAVLKRVDVIPKEGRSVLICIFVLTLYKHVHLYSKRDRNAAETTDVSTDNTSGTGKLVKGRAEGSIQGEEVEIICIRDKNDQHTEEYSRILSALGKPSSWDRQACS